tara:strand:- start:4089 stop:5858 length:1770 start_codon:yes stop_codon:yes gene_type:complete
LKIIFDLIKSHKFITLTLIIISIAAAFFEALGIAIILPFLGALLDNNIETEQFSYFINLINNIWTGENKIIFFIITILVLFIIKNFLIYIRSILTTYFQNDIRKFLSVEILNKYHLASISSLSKDKPGKLLNNLIQEPVLAGKFFAKSADLIAQSLIVIMIFSVLLISNPKLMIILTSVIVALLFLFGVFFRRLINFIGRKRLKLVQEISNQGEQSIRAIRDIKLLQLNNKTVKSFIDKYNHTRSILFKLSSIQNLPMPLTEIIIVTSASSFIFYIEIIQGRSIVDFIPFLGFILIASQRLASNLSQILSSRIFLQAYIPSLRLIHEIIFRNRYQENVRSLNNVNNYKEIKEIKKLSVKQISLSYDTKNYVLKNLSLDIKEKSIVAIVGKSGSGKSSLVDIICGFYNQDQGIIMNEQDDIREYELEEWRKNISLVSKLSFFFPGTIKSNLLLANERSTDDEIQEAIKISQSKEFIDNLPEGIDTYIDSTENSLSAGQYQRLAIARSILRKTKLIILDEATNHLDVQSEKRLMNELSTIKNDRMILMITHNIKSLEYADYIYVLDNGAIVEEGKLDQLIKSKSKFTKLFN